MRAGRRKFLSILSGGVLMSFSKLGIAVQDSSPISIGTKIWCPVFHAHEPGMYFHEELERPSFSKHKNDTIIYATHAPDYCLEKWVVAPRTYFLKDHKNFVAVRCICMVKIDPTWTYFEVVDVKNGQPVVVPVVGKERDVLRLYPFDKLLDAHIPII
ncbi:MAG: hypothetical protein AAB522_02855 [Patescibacteria group bacterium]